MHHCFQLVLPNLYLMYLYKPLCSVVASSVAAHRVQRRRNLPAWPTLHLQKPPSLTEARQCRFSLVCASNILSTSTRIGFPFVFLSPVKHLHRRKKSGGPTSLSLKLVQSKSSRATLKRTPVRSRQMLPSPPSSCPSHPDASSLLGWGAQC